MPSINVTSFESLYHVCALSDGCTAPWERLRDVGPWSVPVEWLRATPVFSLHSSYAGHRQLVVSAVTNVLKGINDLLREEFDDGLWWPLLNEDQLLVPHDQSRFAWLHGNESWLTQGFGPRWTDVPGWSERTFLPSWERTSALKIGGIAHYHGERGRMLMFWSPATANDGTVVTGGLWVWADPQLRSSLGLPAE